MARTVAYGTGRIHFSPEGTIATLANLAALDTVAAGGSWGTAWRDFGLKSAAPTLRQGRDDADIMSVDLFDPYDVVASGRNVGVAATIMQFNLDLLAEMLGYGTYSTTAATATTSGHRSLVIKGGEMTVKRLCIGFELAPPKSGGVIIRIVYPSVVPVTAMEYSADRTTPAGVAFDGRALPYESGTENNVVLYREVLPIGYV